MFIKNKKLRGILGAVLLITLLISFSLTPFTLSKYVHTSSGSALSSMIDGTIEKKDVTLTGIVVDPKKNAYDMGKDETFQPTDLTVTAMYSDGSAAEVTDFTVEFDDANAANFAMFGEKKGTVTYNQKDDNGNIKASATNRFTVYK